MDCIFCRAQKWTWNEVNFFLNPPAFFQDIYDNFILQVAKSQKWFSIWSHLRKNFAQNYCPSTFHIISKNGGLWFCAFFRRWEQTENAFWDLTTFTKTWKFKSWVSIFEKSCFPKNKLKCLWQALTLTLEGSIKEILGFLMHFRL